ncbi:MAG: hypothetical protein ACP5D7_16555 [Limnospira sp.]
MTENQTETPQKSAPQGMGIRERVFKLLGSWKLRFGAVGILIIIVGLIGFFWAHMVAGLGMRVWSNSSGATPIECMMRDTNGDEYVSCSAILNEQVVPLECGSSIFNIGCRINYGAAAPGIRKRDL